MAMLVDAIHISISQDTRLSTIFTLFRLTKALLWRSPLHGNCSQSSSQRSRVISFCTKSGKNPTSTEMDSDQQLVAHTMKGSANLLGQWDLKNYYYSRTMNYGIRFAYTPPPPQVTQIGLHK